jgi:hypothetical protein
MKVLKATDSAVNAIRKMDNVSRSLVSSSGKKQSSFFAEGSKKYHGPFMVSWAGSGRISIKCPPEFMGNSNGYCGSICAPDMQVVKHILVNYISFTEGQENTLLVLKVIWGCEGIDNYSFQFVPYSYLSKKMPPIRGHFL